MNKKIIIDAEEIKNRFRSSYGHKHQGRFMFENEVKLFTNKEEMVTYVNSLTQIENVEIFKIEDNLYKVLVSRVKKVEQKECCKEHHGEETE
jgi:hypothetical protein